MPLRRYQAIKQMPTMCGMGDTVMTSQYEDYAQKGTHLLHKLTEHPCSVTCLPNHKTVIFLSTQHCMSSYPGSNILLFPVTPCLGHIGLGTLWRTQWLRGTCET